MYVADATYKSFRIIVIEYVTDTERVYNKGFENMNKRNAAFALLMAAMTVFALGGMASAGQIGNVQFDIQSGSLSSTLSSYDNTNLHPGVLGETNTFTGVGGFKGSDIAYEQTYGSQSTYVNANGVASNGYLNGANLKTVDDIHFDITSGNHENGINSEFTAIAQGSASADPTQNVGMNLKSVGSMYVWGEATNNYWLPPVQGQYIAKEVETTGPNTYADLVLSVGTTGVATMSNSNIWGWGADETGTATTNYAGGVRSLSSTGAGNYVQFGQGENTLTFNLLNMPGGGIFSTSGIFNNGLTGTYNMQGN